MCKWSLGPSCGPKMYGKGPTQIPDLKCVICRSSTLDKVELASSTFPPPNRIFALVPKSIAACIRAIHSTGQHLVCGGHNGAIWHMGTLNLRAFYTPAFSYNWLMLSHFLRENYTALVTNDWCQIGKYIL